MNRRHWLCQALVGAAALPAAAQTADPDADPVRRGRPLAFPRDHGAHLSARTEWWYATGWLGRPEAPSHGFQVTFFRSRTGLAERLDSRFAPRHLLFAHAAVTDLVARRHHHQQRIVRWNGSPGAGPAAAGIDDADVAIGAWRLWRQASPEPGRYATRIEAPDAFTLDLVLQPGPAPLLQGDAGFSRKGPDEAQASHYYSETQLAARGSVSVDGRTTSGSGRAWLDHEWSTQILHPDAVGWDWLGINLFDGGALTAFRLRRADGSALWAGGSFRPTDGAARSFTAGDVRFTPGRRWASPATGANYPVHWTVETPAGRFELRALLDEQELDGRSSTGTLYWEGLSELLDGDGRRIGLGYLEMTGYAGRLRLG